VRGCHCNATKQMKCEWRASAMIDQLIIRAYNFNHDPKRNMTPKLSSFRFTVSIDINCSAAVKLQLF
jgi:hypothetical protein